MRHLIAISGSLRAASSNTALLRAAAAVAPAGVAVTLYAELGDLPHFHPDVAEADAPPVVRRFRDHLRAADGVLVCSPEYAHGVPGVLKDALDWVVSSGELVDKPVGLVSASAAAVRAQASLTATLTVMGARLVADASVTVPLPSNKLDADAILADPARAAALRAAVAALAAA